MVITLKTYGEIRKLALEGVSGRQIAARLGISRNTVRKYLEGERVPWERKAYHRKESVLTEDVRRFVDECLKEDDAVGSNKQRHTARRIYDRLVVERGYSGGESTIRKYVHERRGKVAEAFVPLAFEAGDAVQIDWGEAQVVIAGERTKVNLFCGRLCYSDAPFVAAYRRQNSESFLDGLVRMFSYFAGATKRVIFDNARVAVKDGFGAQARAQDGYKALAAHYGFETVFCNPSSGNEKGLVEGLVGFSRRNFCVPMPRVEDMEELNAKLLSECERYLTHRITGKEADVGEMLERERKVLRALPKYDYDPARRSQGRVTAFATVRYDTNSYSVPVEHCGKTVAIKALPERIEVYLGGKMVAIHGRCFGRHQNIYKLEHYLPLLEIKGRALFQAKPVRDNVPPHFIEWLEAQKLDPKGLVALLRNGQEIGFDAVMRGEVPTLPPPAADIKDPVLVSDVDLKAYDELTAQTGVVA